MRECLTALLAAALFAGCGASRPPVCQPDGNPTRNASAVAGRVLVGIAEVLVGAELVDHERGCTDVGEHARRDTVGALPTAASDRPLTSAGSPAEHAAGAADASHAERRLLAARQSTKADGMRTRPGRWILVRKADRTLSVFDADRRVKTYAVVLGEDPIHPKLYEGDRRTPEGEYHVIAKHGHPEWQRFLLLDYPNADDREVYSWRRAKGLVPARGGSPAGTGGAIGIHGTRDDDLNRKGINWTYGCVSLLSRDIEELYDMVPVGTAVVIEH